MEKLKIAHIQSKRLKEGKVTSGLIRVQRTNFEQLKSRQGVKGTIFLAPTKWVKCEEWTIFKKE